MNYALLDSNGYVISLGSGDSLPDGCVEVNFEIPPSPGPFHRLDFNQQQWVQIPNNQKIEMLSREARLQRNRFLSATDWTQISDSPLTAQSKSDWMIYRQQLRDVTHQPEFPLNIVWPIPPT